MARAALSGRRRTASELLPCGVAFSQCAYPRPRSAQSVAISLGQPHTKRHVHCSRSQRARVMTANSLSVCQPMTAGSAAKCAAIAWLMIRLRSTYTGWLAHASRRVPGPNRRPSALTCVISRSARTAGVASASVCERSAGPGQPARRSTRSSQAK